LGARARGVPCLALVIKKKLLRIICSLADSWRLMGQSFKACVFQTPQEKLSCLGSHDKGEKSVHRCEGGWSMLCFRLCPKIQQCISIVPRILINK
jgi:hypothetical protein